MADEERPLREFIENHLGQEPDYLGNRIKYDTIVHTTWDMDSLMRIDVPVPGLGDTRDKGGEYRSDVVVMRDETEHFVTIRVGGGQPIEVYPGMYPIAILRIVPDETDDTKPEQMMSLADVIRILNEYWTKQQPKGEQPMTEFRLHEIVQIIATGARAFVVGREEGPMLKYAVHAATRGGWKCWAMHPHELRKTEHGDAVACNFAEPKPSGLEVGDLVRNVVSGEIGIITARLIGETDTTPHWRVEAMSSNGETIGYIPECFLMSLVAEVSDGNATD